MQRPLNESAFVGVLHERYGMRPIGRAELLRALRVHIGEQTLPDVALRALLHVLLSSGLIAMSRDDGTYRVTSRGAMHAASTKNEPDAIPEQALDAVTRRFLEEVLHDASVPRELLDEIVRTYQLRGRIEMSEDGNRYVIRLAARD